METWSPSSFGGSSPLFFFSGGLGTSESRACCGTKTAAVETSLIGCKSKTWHLILHVITHLSSRSETWHIEHCVWWVQETFLIFLYGLKQFSILNTILDCQKQNESCWNYMYHKVFSKFKGSKFLFHIYLLWTLREIDNEWLDILMTKTASNFSEWMFPPNW